MAQNGVIIYMSRLKDAPLLFRSVCLLHKHFKYAKDYPIVVFHDDLTQVVLSQLRVAWHQELGYIPNVQFEILKFQFPPGFVFDESKVLADVPLSEFWIGYRHMCRFHSGEIYKDPRLLKYDYYWRLDSDSWILGPIDFDPFDYMAQNDLEYAYMCDEDMEVPRVAQGLWETTVNYIYNNELDVWDNLTPHLVGKNEGAEYWNHTLFYTNFEIAKFSFFRGEQYQSYYNHLDATGNFYYNRWGDAPVHWLGVRMFLPDSKVWAVKNIPYMHAHWIRNLSAIPGGKTTEPTNRYLDVQPIRDIYMYSMKRYQKTGIDKNNFGDSYDGVY